MTDNGLCFYNIFETRELAVAHLEGDVRPDEWREDASGDLSYLPEGGYHYFISQEPYTAEKRGCGGCQGQGAHRRWCRQVVGLGASVYGPMSEQLESMGDTVGPNNMELSNRLWALSADMKTWAKSLFTKTV